MKEKSKGVFLFLFLMAILVIYTFYRGHVHKQYIANLPNDAVVGQGKPVLLQVGASWCPPCREMVPVMAGFSQSHSAWFTAAYVDVERQPEAGDKYQVGPIPLILFFDAKGNVLYRHEGYMPKERVLEKWGELGLEMK